MVKKALPDPRLRGDDNWEKHSPVILNEVKDPRLTLKSKLPREQHRYAPHNHNRKKNFVILRVLCGFVVKGLDNLGIISYNKIWLNAPALPANISRAKAHQDFHDEK